MRKVGDCLPTVEFILRENGEFINKRTEDLFEIDKEYVIFSLPGAFTPTCTSYQLPGYEELYDEFIKEGFEDIYCISVNDAFVMNAWAKELGIEKVKMLSDGNGYFTRSMGQLVMKSNLGFGQRSWRYAAVINSPMIEGLFVEPGMRDNAPEDPYEVTSPENILNFIKTDYSDIRKNFHHH
jgi:peroxiredoxin